MTGEQLRRDRRNANKGTARGRALLGESLRRYGAGRSILADRHGVIIAGNKTHEVATAQGLPVRVVETDGSELVVVRRTDLDLEADPRARALAYADNRTAELDLDWDLDHLLADRDAGIDLAAVGFTAADLAELLAARDGAGGGGGGGDPDAIPAPPAAPVTRPGDCWRLGEHLLICGDAADPAVVARVGGADCPALDFDPPYDAAPALIALRWPARDVLVFTDHRHTLDAVAGQPRFRNLFAWDGQTSWYVRGQPLARAKFCLWFGASDYDEDGAHYGEPGAAHEATNTRGTYRYRPDPRGKHLSTVFSAPATRQEHPHEKPADWVRCLLANCTRGDIFSPFAGWGTSCIAAEQLGRRWRGIEIEPGRCDAIVQRWQEFTGRRATRVPPGSGA